MLRWLDKPPCFPPRFTLGNFSVTLFLWASKMGPVVKCKILPSREDTNILFNSLSHPQLNERQILIDWNYFPFKRSFFHLNWICQLTTTIMSGFPRKTVFHGFRNHTFIRVHIHRCLKGSFLRDSIYFRAWVAPSPTPAPKHTHTDTHNGNQCSSW